MELAVSAFEDLHPGRRLEFEFPLRELCGDGGSEGQEGVVSVVVLDSNLEVDEGTTQCAAMLVPFGREEDWMYSTEGGQWQLLASAAVSRMILFCYRSSKPQVRENANLLREPNAAKTSTHQDTPAGNRHRPKHKERASQGRNPSRPQVEVAREDRKSVDEVSRCGWSCTEEFLETNLSRLVLALAPKILSHRGLPDVPFVSYTDNVVDRIILEECFSPLTGFIVVEDVELRQDDFEIDRNELDICPSSSSSFDTVLETDAAASVSKVICRRLRFKRMPNLIQTEVRVSVSQACVASGSSEMAMRTVDHDVIVHKYLAPIVGGLVLVAPCLETCSATGAMPSVLCIGVGGGALPSFLHRHFPFRIQAVDLDEVVLRLARQYFGLSEDGSLEVKACDGLKLLEEVAETVVRMNLVSDSLARTWQELILSADMTKTGDFLDISIRGDTRATDRGAAITSASMALNSEDPRFHLIVLDVDAGDPKLEISSPPADFLSKPFLLSARICLYEGGMLVMNVVPRNHKSFGRVVSALKEVFAQVYAIDVEDDINEVVFGLPSELLSTDVVGPLSSQVRKLVGTNLVRRIYRL